jgi:hypothetical protein
MRTELKLIREDIHRITLELNERVLKVEKLQNKYETINSKNHGTEDGEEPKSQAYYVSRGGCLVNSNARGLSRAAAYGREWTLSI